MKYLLYSLLVFMLFIALSFIIIFYYRNRSAVSFINIFFLILFIIFFSTGSYYFNNNLQQIEQWYTYGKKQYQFLTDYQKLGGIEGMIQRLQRKLDENPQNLQAWIILGKLYLAKQEYPEASGAFARALQLQPENIEIKEYLEIAKHS